MKELDSYKEMIEQELKSFFSLKKEKAKSISPLAYDGFCKIEEFTMRGGKRIRPLLVVVSYLGCGGKNLKEILKASISAEIAHSFLLIHDDVMDDDDMRRNAPTVHKILEKQYNKSISKALALTLGDLGACFSFEPLLNSSFEAELKLKAMKEIVGVIERTCYGQYHDIIGEIIKTDEEFIRIIHENKTAYYTVAGPLIVGATLAGASREMIDRLTQVGIKMGLAFQVQDDILGVFGDEEETGKAASSDLIEGKKTLLIVKANSDYVNKKIGTPLSKQEIQKIREIIVNSGSLEYSENTAHRLLQDARKDLQKLNIKDNEKKILLYLVDYLEKRKS